jgi:hypothetical protein
MGNSTNPQVIPTADRNQRSTGGMLDVVTNNFMANTAKNVLNAPAAFQAGMQQNKALRFGAKQIEANAKAKRAEGTRVSEEGLRKGRVLQSNIRAATAGTGGAKDAGTVQNEATAKQVTDANALNAIFESEEQAKGMDLQAKTMRAQAKAAKKSPTDMLGKLYLTGSY